MCGEVRRRFVRSILLAPPETNVGCGQNRGVSSEAGSCPFDTASATDIGRIHLILERRPATGDCKLYRLHKSAGVFNFGPLPLYSDAADASDDELVHYPDSAWVFVRVRPSGRYIHSHLYS